MLLYHMYHHLDIALDMDPKHATNHVRFAAAMRMVIMAAVLAVSMYFQKYAHPMGAVLTIFGVKISAFIQPILHGFLEKRDIKL